MRASLILALGLLAAACSANTGQDAPSTTVASTTIVTTVATSSTMPTTTATTVPVSAGFPVTILAGNGEVEIGDRPTSIVSLSPASTEILFAIGAGDQVTAVDEFSDYPAEAPTTALSGLTPNVEAIAEFGPDLVVMSFDPGGVEEGLARLDIPVIVHFSAVTLADTYMQIEQLGAATGHVGEAAELVGQMQSDLGALVAEFEDSAAGLTYFHELDDTFYTATSSTFIGELYALFGLVNIADSQDADGFGFPQLSPEYIIEADPDLIFLADTKCCGQSADSVAGRPGWGNLQAVTGGNVIELDDDIASRWGPRVVDFVEAVAAAIRELQATG